MSTRSRHQILRVLQQFVRGRASLGDLYGCVEQSKFNEVEELLEHVRLSGSDFDQLALDEQQLTSKLEEYLSGKLDFWDLSDWALQLYRIFASSEYRRSRRYSARVDRALMLLALSVDLDLTETIENSNRLCHRLANALQKTHRLPCETILRQLFRSKRELHFASSVFSDRGGEQTSFPPPSGEWLDIALISNANQNKSLDLPGENDTNANLSCHGWFIPIAVCTRHFFDETRPEGSWCHRENDKVLELADLGRNRPDRFGPFDLAGLSSPMTPQYFVDPDGLVEVVVDVPEVGPYEAELAVRLFCLRNGVSRCFLDEAPVFPAKEEL